MKRPLFSALALGAAALATAAQAGDRLPVVQVKFSASSQRVMALTVGSQDGSGFGAAGLSVLNTLSGVTLYSKSATSTSTPDAARTALLTTPPTPAVLASNGLAVGVVSVPKFVRSYAAALPDYAEAVKAGQTQLTPVALWTGPVPIKLSVFARSSTCSSALLNGYAAAGFKLQVRNQVVHVDPMTATDHKCAVGYTLDRVDVRGNRILLTVRAYNIGFEGPNAEPIYVAAKLN